MQLTTHHTPYFTVVFKLCSPNCSSFLCPVPRPTNSLLSPPNPVVSSLPIISFLPCVYGPCIFHQSLPLTEHWAHLISISSFHYCYKVNHHHINLVHSWDEELDYGHRSALYLYTLTLLHQPLLCLLSCVFTVNTQDQGWLSSFSLLRLAQQDLNITLNSFCT